MVLASAMSVNDSARQVNIPASIPGGPLACDPGNPLRAGGIGPSWHAINVAKSNVKAIISSDIAWIMRERA
jgi:hypothetical protein